MSSRWGPEALAITLALVAACAPAEPPSLALPPLRDGIAFPAPSIARSVAPSGLELERELLRTRGEDDPARLRRIQLRLAREGEGDLGAALAESGALRSPPLRAAARSAIHLLLDRPTELFAEAAPLLGRELAPCTELLPIPPATAPEDAPAIAALRTNVELARRRLGFVPEPQSSPPAEPLDRRRRAMILATLASDAPTTPEGFEPLATALAEVGDELLLHELAWLRTPGAFDAPSRAARASLRAIEERSPNAPDRPALLALAAASEPFVAVRALALALYESILSGDHAAAREIGGRIEARCEALGCLLERALAHSDLGTVLSREGAFPEAEANYVAALELLPDAFATRRLEVEAKRATGALHRGRRETAERKRASVLRGLQRLGMRAQASESLAVYADGEEDGRVEFAAAAACAALETANDELFGGLAVARLEQGAGLHEAVLRRVRTARARAEALHLIDRQRAALDIEVEALLALRRWDEAAAVHALRVALPGMSMSNRVISGAELRSRIEEGRGDLVAAIDERRRVLELVARPMTMARSPTDRRGLEAELVVAAFRLASTAKLAASSAADGSVSPALEAAAAAIFGPEAPPAGTCELAARLSEGHLAVLTRSGAGVRLDEQPRAPGTLPLGGDPDSLAGLADWLGPIRGPARCPEASTHVAVNLRQGTLAGPLVTALQARDGATSFDARFGLPPVGTPSAHRRALVVLAPERVAGSLAAPPLPGAERERAALLAAFPAARTLRGPEPTPAAVTAALAESELVHLAVHGAAGLGEAVATRLLLAGPNGELDVRRIAAARLPEGALVVLASCRTAGQPSSIEQDGGGLPWALLVAGAGLVVAHESDLPDETSVLFSEALYGALARSPDIEAAVAAGRKAVERSAGGVAAARFVVYRR